MLPPVVAGGSAGPFQVSIPAGGNDAEFLCFFTGAGGDPTITISDGTVTQTYVRQGSTSSGTQIPTGGFARYIDHADPAISRTVTVTVNYNGSTGFGNV